MSDTDDFAVACGATELPVQNGAHGETKRISMRFKKGTCEYEVWHHVAPFDRFGIGKMTWSEKARYARYVLILAGGRLWPGTRVNVSRSRAVLVSKCAACCRFRLR